MARPPLDQPDTRSGRGNEPDITQTARHLRIESAIDGAAEGVPVSRGELLAKTAFL